MHNENIAHSGTLGMKWGRRLYQYKDGSLTPLGRLRYGSKGDRTWKPVTVKNPNSKSKSSNSEEESEQDYYKRMKSKSASELTDAELNKLSNRLQAENLYNQRLKENIPPDEHARVKKIIEDLGEKAVRDISGKAIEAVGQKVSKAILGNKENTITKLIKDADLSKVSDAALKKMVERAQNENKLKSALNFGNEKTEKTQNSENKKTYDGNVDDSKKNDTSSTNQTGNKQANVVDGEWKDVTENPGANNGSMKQLLLEDKKRNKK